MNTPSVKKTLSTSATEESRWQRFISWLAPWAAQKTQQGERYLDAEVKLKEAEAMKTAAEAAKTLAEATGSTLANAQAFLEFSREHGLSEEITNSQLHSILGSMNRISELTATLREHGGEIRVFQEPPSLLLTKKRDE